MSCAVDNNAFEMIITPSRKRKRNSGHLAELPSQDTPSKSTIHNIHKTSAFANAAFSSTPKKEIHGIIQKFNRFPPSKRGARPPLGKENGHGFTLAAGTDPCLEVKSIVDLVNQNSGAPESSNPFEVIRKPPKKKKKSDLEEACFVNTGLNLDIPEKQFNPFEVRRETPTKLVRAAEPQCFVNPALNIRIQDTTAARNPFEIQRITPVREDNANGIENPGLDLANVVPLRIGIPFKPTVGCRIDFRNLTPSKLLAEKLVFSSPIVNPKTPRVLADISEEDTTMDIGKELDLYQLELENSINEAKQRKTTTTKSDCRTFNEKLEDIQENSQEDEEAESQEPKTPEVPHVQVALENKKLEDVETPPVQKNSELENAPNTATVSFVVNKTYVKEPEEPNESFTDDEGIDYDDTEDDEGDFKAPAPFVRAYRKADPIPPSPLSIENHTAEVPKATETKSSMKSMLRNSIRKLIHSNKDSNDAKIEKKPLASAEHHSTGTHFMETIRHSLRRKPQKEATETQQTVELPSAREISIIDTSERKMKLKSNALQNEYIKMEDLTSERKTSLRSSIRKSTRDVKNQIMKSVFHKNTEEYKFSK